MLAGDPPSAGGERSLVCAKTEERLFGGFRVDGPAAKRSPNPSPAPSRATLAVRCGQGNIPEPLTQPQNWLCTPPCVPSGRTLA